MMLVVVTNGGGVHEGWQGGQHVGQDTWWRLLMWLAIVILMEMMLDVVMEMMDMEVDKVANIMVNMEVDKVADEMADMEIVDWLGGKDN